MTDKRRGDIKKMNRDYLNKIEVLNFYDVLADDQKQSFMMLIDTLRLFCEKRSREDDISVRGNML